MNTDKRLKIGLASLGILFITLVSLKIVSGTKAPASKSNQVAAKAVVATKLISKKMGSINPKHSVAVDVKLLSETNSKINELNLVDPRVCKKQSDCPYDLFGVYKQSINANSIENNVLSFVLLQKKIAQSDLPKAKKVELLREILTLTGHLLEKGVQSRRLGRKLAVTETAGLYLATLESFVLAGPSPRDAVSNVYDSILKSQDVFVNQMAVFVLMKHYPDHRERLVKLFEQSEIKGFVVARN